MASVVGGWACHGTPPVVSRGWGVVPADLRSDEAATVGRSCVVM